MPPKKASAQASGTRAAPKPKSETKAADSPQAPNQGSKRKQAANNDEPQKAPRRSGRGGVKSEIPPEKLISYLMSARATDLCRPKDEQDAHPETITYTSNLPMTPFEELLCAVILSRPISHALGQRSIRTLLNKPYEFRSPKAIKAAGSEKVHEALETAKTQHKAKTAEQIVMLADVVSEKFADSEEDVSLEKLRKEAQNDPDAMRDTISKSFKGVGKTGVDIFMRRIQGQWRECYPFVDEKTRASVEKYGLDGSAKGLRNQVNDVWVDLDLGQVSGKDAMEKERMVFMRVLERAIVSDLEGKVDAMLAEAAEY
ncbi:MAG: hypothetical protein M1828_001942 [Chrysothrix sp. TS-e1954]|nr:MAG: hypothetical protein M1828_001942 [Chrysothrix sp. TS-e1954]